MNFFDLTGCLFIGFTVWGCYKKFYPIFNKHHERFYAMGSEKKTDAKIFLNSLTLGQIYQVKTWISYKEISPGLIDSIGIKRYILLTDGGIGLTLEMCPDIFTEVIKENAYQL